MIDHPPSVAGETLGSHAAHGPDLLGRLTNRVFSFPAAILAILVAKAFWTCRSRIADPDIFWHLHNAERLLVTHHFPNFDTYSFTAAGAPWMNHSWLSELLFYSGFHAFGLQGLFVIAFVAVAILSVSIFLLCLSQTKDPLAAGIASAGGVVLGTVGFAPRTQLFGWLCFVAIFAILLCFRSNKAAPLWAIPVLFCLWINCNASWPFGLVVYGIVFAVGLIGRDLGPLAAARWSASAIKKLSVTLALSIAALFVNPFGYRLVGYPLDFALRQTLNVELVEEWASVNFNDSRGAIVLVVLGAVFLMALMPRKKWRIDDVALTAFALYGGLTHIRLLLPAGIILAPTLAPQLGEISSYRRGHERRFVNAIFLVAVLALIVFAFPSTPQLHEQIRQYFPTEAVHYLKGHPQEGNMFNFYDWGGYLQWELPNAKVFIDSRADIFEYKGVLNDYFRIGVLDDSEELLGRYDIKYVVYPPKTPLIYLLTKSGRWEQIYRDANAVILRSRRP
jgi:hypothetical protein